MRITVIGYGTRGDVQPVLALSKALQDAGHRVRVLVGANFEQWVEGHGLEVATTRVDMRALMGSDQGQSWIEQGGNQLYQVRRIQQLFATYGPQLARDAWPACRDADLVVSSFTSDVYAASIAEKLSIAHVIALLQPLLVATRSGSASTQPLLAGRDSVANYLFTKWVIDPFNWRMMGAINNDLRQKALGLSPQTREESRAALRRALVVHGFSRHVVPPAADWPPNVRTAGYWFLDEDDDWQPPPDLALFLKEGSPPVYAGFGSITGSDPGPLTELMLQAMSDAEQRVILQAGWSGLGQSAGTDLPASVFLLDAAPHHRLFPHLGAVVHHGGAGTTAEGLRAGVPAVIVPHMADQPFWGRRVAALGVGPAPIPRAKLTAPRLTEAVVQAVGDAGMRRRAAELAALIGGEDGLGTAVNMIEEFVATGSLPA